MKKPLMITVSVVIVIAILIAGFEIFDYTMIPKAYREQSISFINDNIQWSDSINKIKRCLGDCSVTKDAFNNAKTYHFQSTYDTCSTDILFATPNCLSKHISGVTYIFHVPEDKQQVVYKTMKEKLKNECKNSKIPILTDTDRIFEASESGSTYGITYTLSKKDAKIVLQIDLLY